MEEIEPRPLNRTGAGLTIAQGGIPVSSLSAESSMALRCSASLKLVWLISILPITMTFNHYSTIETQMSNLAPYGVATRYSVHLLHSTIALLHRYPSFKYVLQAT